MVMKASATKSLQPSEVRTISAGEFKAKCLSLMDEVNQGKLTIIITKHGKPVSQLTAPSSQPKPFRSVVGRSPSIKILGDIISPLPQEMTLPEWAWESPRTPSRKAKKRK
jgi:prevent-host-death family protein